MPTLAKLAYQIAGWKTPIVITEQSGADLLDYQIGILLNSSWDGWDKVKADGSDIFFLDQEGNPLYFWIDYFDAVNKVAKLWVKVPQIPANSTKAIYMYYGGLNIFTAYRDPYKVFDFFDDFEYATLDEMLAAKWAISQKLPHNNYTVTFENSLIKVHRDYTGSAGTGAVAFYTPNYTVDTSKFFVLEARAYHVKIGTRSLVGFGWYWGEAGGNGYWFRPESTTGSYDKVQILKCKGGSWGSLAVDELQNFYEKWFRSICVVKGTDFYCKLETEDKSLTVELSASDSEFTIGSLLLNFEWTLNDQETWVDWILLRKYVEPEPQVTIYPSARVIKDLDLM